MSNNYTVYHLHDDNSLLDSCTNYKQYIDKAIELSQTSICFSNHGNIYDWIEKKLYCDELGIKYMFGVECYLTEHLEPKIRDNYHTVLIAKNDLGRVELQRLLFNATNNEHKYYKPRISFDEFLNISDNIIKISACLASPLNRIRDLDRVEKLFKHYDYYEIQYHPCENQIEYNQYLYRMSQKYNKPLIVGTDTHSLDSYKAECRIVFQMGKDAEFSKGDSDGSNEDKFDLTYKSYDELVQMFEKQNSLPMDIVLQAIENTNIMSDMVESFKIDPSIKYPILYGENDEKVFKDIINDKYKYKLNNGIIKKENSVKYIEQIKEEMRVFKKVDMIGFMLFMSELMTWCRENNIYTSPCRGSVGGSIVAYISDITDVDPIIWDTVFSRFCNEDRKEIGDIDIDVYEDQRQLVYDYIVDRFGKENTGYILSTGTAVDKGTIDIIGKALRKRWARKTARENGIKHKKEIEKDFYNGSQFGYELDENESSLIKREIKLLEDSFENPWNLSKIKQIKSGYEIDPELTKNVYSELFYYFDGILNTKTSQSQHPAGIIASPINLIDNYGMFIGENGQYILPINMEEIHEIGLAKYDILGLKNVGIVRKCCEYIGIKPPLSHEINWNNKNVFDEVLKSPIGMFQFEGDYSYKLLCDYIRLKESQGKQPTVADFTLINACLRPSGESYRDSLIRGEFNNNPSKIINDLLSDTQGFLVYQEQTILFLQHICGLSGSEADNVRRAIGRKQLDRLQDALPNILEGYCKMSNQPRNIAEEEAKQFLKIIEDSASYQFGKNHSTGYSLLAYILMYMRYYHPAEFCTAYLNCAGGQTKEQDIKDGTQLLISKGIKLEKPKFGKSLSNFVCDALSKTIYKGLGSIKDVGKDTGDKLSTLYNKHYSSFFNLLSDIKNISINSKQLNILICLDYFSQFGHINQLLSQVKIYSDLSALYDKVKTCKQFRKSDLSDYFFTEDELSKCSGITTDKMFKDLDNAALIELFRKHYKQILDQVSQKYPYAPTTIMDKLKYEIELLGYTDLIDENVSYDYHIVTGLEVNQWGNTFITLYHICDGISATYKMTRNKGEDVGKKWLKSHPIEVGDILDIALTTDRDGHYEQIDDKKKWINDDTYTLVIANYKIIK